MGDLALLGVIVVIGIVLFAVFRSMRSHPGGATSPAGTATRSVSNKAQIIEDIKSTQTSRVVDAVAILEELSKGSPTYRQYTELVGTTQSTSSVLAPYSKREVAYYDLRCFKIENIGGHETETLIAHEKSIEPFYFNDGSCEENIYIDLDSFGDNVILVNSANRIEGPGSDFAKALDASTRGTSTSSPNAYAIIGGLRDRAPRLHELLRNPLSLPEFAFDGIGALSANNIDAFTSAPFTKHGASSNYALMGHHGHGSGFGSSMGDFDFDSFGNLGEFLGMPGNIGNIGGPRGDYWRGDGKSDAGDVLLGMGLGALISTLASNAASDQYAPVTPQSQFRGYRIVEDVIPLNYQVYALGEIYKNGPHVTMGRSTSSSYPSSFFATKPEAEVITHLNGQ